MRIGFRKISGILFISGLLVMIYGCFNSKNNKGETEMSDMEKPVYNYVEGWYDKDSERLKQGLHPDLVKRSLDTGGKNGIRDINLENLVDILPQYGGQSGPDRKIEIEILDTRNNIATAKVISNDYVDYIHLGFWKDQWWIINVLWEFAGEDVRDLTDREITALEKPVRDYIEGWYDKDPDRMKQGLHPDLAKRSMNYSRPNGMDEYTRSSLLALVPQYGGYRDERIVEIEILDICQNIASVKVTSNNYIDYLHLIYWQGQWWVLNALWCNK